MKGRGVEAFEVAGEWWLPEAPDRRVSGTLSVVADGRAELSLIGAFRRSEEAGEVSNDGQVTTVQFTERSLAASGLYPRIHGQAGSDAITLDDCFQTRRTGLFGGHLPTERIHVGRVLKGAWFASGEALSFHKAFVHLDWLAYWLMQSGLEESHEFKAGNEDGSEEHEATILKIRPIPDAKFDGPEGASFTLGQSYSVQGDRVTERVLKQDFYFAVARPETVELSRLLDQISDLQDLVSIGTGRTAAFTRLVLKHPEVTRTINEGDTYELPIELHAQWNTRRDEGAKRPLSPHEMLFTLADLGGTEGLARWLEVASRYRSELGRVMSTRYAEGMYVSDRLLNCAAALEAYDRSKYGDDIWYVERLKRCAVTAGDLFEALVGDTEKWARILKNSRNDVAHHNHRLDSASTAYLFLSHTAYWLFVLCLLRDSGAPGAVFERMQEHGQFNWLREQISQIVLSTPSAD